MRYAAAATALLAALLLPHAASAATPEQRALQGIAKALAAGRIPPDQAAADRFQVRRAGSLWKRLPAARGAALKAVLGDVAALSGSYTGPRAIALFGELKANADYLATHPLLGRRGQDIGDADGVVYRYVPGHGFQFHPLGNFGALNAAVASGDQDRTRRLADALLARAVGGGVWEYYYGFGGGRPPWTSGMAQAVAAQAFARAGSTLGEPAYTAVAQRAFAAIPGRLVRARPGGPWIRLYSFSTLVVLNAQLQSVISLRDYASLTGDAAATALAASMRGAAASQLPQFDTGFWSYYALPNDDSPLDYQLYVVSLLRRLTSQDPRFGAAATRFLAYTKQPPAFKLTDSRGPAVSFWLSKPGTVTATAGSQVRRLGLAGGWHKLSFALGPRAELLPVHLSAVDYAGNSAAVDALPILRAALAVRAPTASGQPSFVVGAGVDDLAQAPAAAAFGELRVTNPVGPLVSSVPLAVEFTTAPDPAFLASFLEQSPSVRDVLLPADFATLAAVRDAVAGRVRVAGSITDQATLVDLGAAFKASGRTDPIMDELAVATPTLPDYPGLVATLGAAFDGTAQPGSELPILYTHLGTESPSPAEERAQGQAYSAALRATACQPTAAGVFLDRLVDGPEAGQQDGVLRADMSPKASLAVLAPSLAQAQRGILLVCPGLAVPGAATSLTFPEQTSFAAGTRAWSVQLACPRDSLYLVTLERARDGAPMLARRGAVRGGIVPTTVTLPALPVPAGTYRLTVRVVPQVNPGAILLQQSADLVVG
ncbi:MAG TPA: D-glucuronyl C5-epimerase family protein [Gaiellaceae bacterium]